MRAAEVVTASLLMLLGGVVLLDAVRLGFGWGPDGPRSGFFPFWLALIMVFCCAVIIIQAVLHGPGPSFVSRERLAPVSQCFGPRWRRSHSCTLSASTSLPPST